MMKESAITVMLLYISYVITSDYSRLYALQKIKHMHGNNMMTHITKVRGNYTQEKLNNLAAKQQVVSSPRVYLMMAVRPKLLVIHHTEQKTRGYQPKLHIDPVFNSKNKCHQTLGSRDC